MGIGGGAMPTETNTRALAAVGVSSNTAAITMATTVPVKTRAIFIYVPVLPILRLPVPTFERRVSRIAEPLSIESPVSESLLRLAAMNF